MYREPADTDDYYLYQDSSLQSALVIEKRTELLKAPTPDQTETLELEWEKLFCTSHYILKLKERALSGKLKVSSFRSVAWQVFLGVLPTSTEQWNAAVQLNRLKYNDLKGQYALDPHHNNDMSLSVNNPLSQEEDSPWVQFFQDTELRKNIMLDIIRTYPGEIMFEQEEIREMMLNILFIYAREEPETNYKQGMHELLAPLVHVFYTEYTLVGDVAMPTSEDMRNILKVEYLEHDLYWCYVRLMKYTSPYYKTDSVKVDRNQHADQLFKSHAVHSSTYVVQKLSELQRVVLRRYDAELQQHLDKLTIQPQLYGLRWVRLLFGREFSLHDTLIVWDALFASPDFYGMVEYICIAMLLYIRNALLCSDYTGCLTLLMRYPEIPTIHFFVQRALFLRNPSHYECPPNWHYRPLPTRPTRSGSESKSPVAVISDTLKRKIQRPKASPVSYNTPSTSSPPPQRRPDSESEQKRIAAFCSTKLDSLIDDLQSTITDICREETVHEDKLMLSLADLKQVRDILKGNVSLGSVVMGSETVSVTSSDHTNDSVDHSSVSNSVSGMPDPAPPDMLSPIRPGSPSEAFVELRPPPADMETLNLFQDLSVGRKTRRKRKDDSLSAKSESQDFLDPLSSALVDDNSDECPNFLRSR